MRTHAGSTLTGGVALSLAGCLPQQLKRLDIEDLGQPLDSPQAQIALSAFESADVGPVEANEVGEGLLRQAAGVSVGGEIPTQRSL